MLVWTRSSRPACPHPSVYRTAAAWLAPRLLDRHDDASSADASTGGARAPSLRTCRALALAVPHAMLSAVAASPRRAVEPADVLEKRAADVLEKRATRRQTPETDPPSAARPGDGPRRQTRHPSAARPGDRPPGRSDRPAIGGATRGQTRHNNSKLELSCCGAERARERHSYSCNVHVPLVI